MYLRRIIGRNFSLRDAGSVTETLAQRRASVSLVGEGRGGLARSRSRIFRISRKFIDASSIT